MTRTRIAPSPTGYPHIGTIYQVLFDYAYAHKHDGKFVLRIEDTDRVRFVDGAEQVIYDALTWFGLDPDEGPVQGGPYGPYKQSERLEVYKKYAEELIEKGHAYYCFCTKERLDEMRAEQEKNHQPPMYDKRCRNLTKDEVAKNMAAGLAHVIRMKIPTGETLSFDDLLVGKVEFQSELIDDQVLMKTDGFPTYHLAVVVDDHLMEITHIFRGREWIPSTPKHVLLYRFFEWKIPEHVHLPLIINSEGKGKLSKRHGHSSVDYYRKLGYLPEAVLNYLSNIVWNHPEGKEIYSFEEFTRLFEIKDVTSQGPKFDLKKLDWMNGEYIRTVLSEDQLIERVRLYSQYSQTQIKLVLPLVRERLVMLSEFDSLVRFFFEDLSVVLKEDYLAAKGSEASDQECLDYWKSLLLPKHHDAEETKKVLTEIRGSLDAVAEWNKEAIESVLRGLVERTGWKVGELFMLVRVSVTGRTATPPLFEMMELIDSKVILERIDKAIQIL
jgi:glutamyl-tRNA synthetase